jgi:hypothetical protein
VLYLYGLSADVLGLVKGEDCEEDVGISRPGHDWESECHSAVRTLLMRARDGNNGVRVEQGSSIHTTDAAGCCSCTYHSLKESEDIFFSHLIRSCTEGQYSG